MTSTVRLHISFVAPVHLVIKTEEGSTSLHWWMHIMSLFSIEFAMKFPRLKSIFIDLEDIIIISPDDIIIISPHLMKHKYFQFQYHIYAAYILVHSS